MKEKLTHTPVKIIKILPVDDPSQKSPLMKPQSPLPRFRKIRDAIKGAGRWLVRLLSTAQTWVAHQVRINAWMSRRETSGMDTASLRREPVEPRIQEPSAAVDVSERVRPGALDLSAPAAPVEPRSRPAEPPTHSEPVVATAQSHTGEERVLSHEPRLETAVPKTDRATNLTRWSEQLRTGLASSLAWSQRWAQSAYAKTAQWANVAASIGAAQSRRWSQRAWQAVLWTGAKLRERVSALARLVVSTIRQAQLSSMMRPRARHRLVRELEAIKELLAVQEKDLVEVMAQLAAVKAALMSQQQALAEVTRHIEALQPLVAGSPQEGSRHYQEQTKQKGASKGPMPKNGQETSEQTHPDPVQERTHLVRTHDPLP